VEGQWNGNIIVQISVTCNKAAFFYLLASVKFVFDVLIYEGRSKSSWPDLVLIRIKLKYYLLFIVAWLRHCVHTLQCTKYL